MTKIVKKSVTSTFSDNPGSSHETQTVYTRVRDFGAIFNSFCMVKGVFKISHTLTS